jgi:hypothetical protein
MMRLLSTTSSGAYSTISKLCTTLACLCSIEVRHDTIRYDMKEVAYVHALMLHNPSDVRRRNIRSRQIHEG